MTSAAMCAVCYVRPREPGSVKCEDCGTGDKGREDYKAERTQR